MLIRKKGRRIQLVRTRYVKRVITEAGDVKRGTGCQKQEMAGSMLSWETEIPAELKAKLSDEELAQLEAYMAKRDHEDRRLEIRWGFEHRLLDQLRIARRGLEDPPEGQDSPPLSQKHAAAIYEAWDGLARAMRKAGFPRPAGKMAAVAKKKAARKKTPAKKKAPEKAPAAAKAKKKKASKETSITVPGRPL
jgi:hypothetical protein